jgi:hypothetical protein
MIASLDIVQQVMHYMRKQDAHADMINRTLRNSTIHENSRRVVSNIGSSRGSRQEVGRRQESSSVKERSSRTSFRTDLPVLPNHHHATDRRSRHATRPYPPVQTHAREKRPPRLERPLGEEGQLAIPSSFQVRARYLQVSWLLPSVQPLYVSRAGCRTKRPCAEGRPDVCQRAGSEMLRGSERETERGRKRWARLGMTSLGLVR